MIIVLHGDLDKLLAHGGLFNVKPVKVKVSSLRSTAWFDLATKERADRFLERWAGEGAIDEQTSA